MRITLPEVQHRLDVHAARLEARRYHSRLHAVRVLAASLPRPAAPTVHGDLDKQKPPAPASAEGFTDRLTCRESRGGCCTHGTA